MGRNHASCQVISEDVPFWTCLAREAGPAVGGTTLVADNGPRMRFSYVFQRGGARLLRPGLCETGDADWLRRGRFRVLLGATLLPDGCPVGVRRQVWTAQASLEAQLLMVARRLSHRVVAIGLFPPSSARWLPTHRTHKFTRATASGESSFHRVVIG